MVMKVTKVSNSAQVDGIWTTEYNDVSLKIARSDSANYNYENSLTKAMLPHKKKMQKGQSIDNAVAKKLMIRVMAETVLVDWNKPGHKGDTIQEDDGKPAPYSVDNAIELLTLDPDLKSFVDDFAGELDNFLDIEGTVKK